MSMIYIHVEYWYLLSHWYLFKIIICVQFSDENGLVFSRWSVQSVDPQITLFHLLDDNHWGWYLSFLYLIYSITLPD